MKLFFASACCLFIMLGISCSRRPDMQTENEEILNRWLRLPKTPYNYSDPVLPAFFSDQFVTIQDNTPLNNKTTNWGATLGRVLFYDTRLSANNSISCSSCHLQQFGFTDTAQFSKGFMGGNTLRHSMALANAKYYMNGRFFWDERAATLEEQVLMPIQDSVEMGLGLDSLVARLKATQFYPILFYNAFGSSDINPERVSMALAQFVRSIVSYRSKYDEGRKNVADREMDFPNFTAEENEGKTLFMKTMPINCFGCHNTDVLITDNARNNGTSLTNTDGGVFEHTGDPEDMGKFKAPSLKNVALRNRYMHDGKMTGLMAVLNHYNTGLQANPNLDAHIKDGNGDPAKMNLSAKELNALKAFLETLTDNELIQDEKFSSPF